MPGEGEENETGATLRQIESTLSSIAMIGDGRLDEAIQKNDDNPVSRLSWPVSWPTKTRWTRR